MNRINYWLLLASVILTMSPSIGHAIDATWGEYFRVPSEYATIQAALDAAGPSDTVLVSSGTYSGSGNRNIDFQGKSVVIRSVSGESNTVIDCGGAPNRAFVFENGETPASMVKGFTIRNGDVRNRYQDFIPDRDGGAIKIKSASPTIASCTFENCQALLGGAIHMMKATINHPNIAPVIYDCTFLENLSTQKGGAIACASGASPEISQCYFEGNHSNSVGGAIDITSLAASPEITGNMFLENTASFAGGGLHTYSACIVRNCNFVGNSSPNGGGFISRENAVGVVLELNIFAFNLGGSGVHANSGSVVSFECNDFWSNVGGSVTGVYDSLSVDSNSIFEDPLFCDPSAGDYSISSYSPCDEDSSLCGLLIGRFDDSCDRCCNYAGNVNNRAGIDIADLTYIQSYLFEDGPEPPCPEEGNVNGLDGIDVSDLMYLVEYLFAGGTPPVCPE